jgi:DNA invertase Pin-like site-specific DNA recombinase
MNEDEIRLKFLSLKNTEYVQQKGNQKINPESELIPFPTIPAGSTQRHGFLYIRCSTKEQLSGHSLETQLTQLTKYCETHNINILAKFEDAGISGANINNRPGLISMLEALQPGITVLSVAVSRLSRNTVQLLNLVQSIKQKKAEVILLDMSMDTSTPLGNVMLTMLSCLGQFEREQTQSRVSNTLSLLNEQNRLLHKPTWGYKRVKGELIEKPEEQLVVDMIRSIVKNNPNVSINKITDTLNKKGFVNRKNKQFHATTILSIVKTFNIPVKLSQKNQIKINDILDPNAVETPNKTTSINTSTNISTPIINTSLNNNTPFNNISSTIPINENVTSTTPIHNMYNQPYPHNQMYYPMYQNPHQMYQNQQPMYNQNGTYPYNANYTY